MDSDDSDHYTPATAFPIGHLNEDDIDLSVPPANGMEYLQRVMLETKRCDRVVTVKPKIATLSSAKPPLQEEVKTVSPYAPSPEWQERQASNFSQLRQKIVRWRTNQHPKPCISLPSIADKKGWHLLCFGTACGGGIGDGVGNPPHLSILVNIGQPMVDTLLNWHSQWLDECNHITHQHGQWIFGLLSCLELPLHPDTCSTIRYIARVCQQIRNAMVDPDETELAAVNLIICLVGKYFGQADLAD